MGNRRVTLLAGVGVAILLLFALVGLPLIRLFSVGMELGLDGAIEVFSSPRYRTAALNSLWTGLVVVVLALSIGSVAALITRRAGRHGRWLRVGMLVPLVVPPFVSAFSWARAYGPGGLTDDLWGLSFPSLFGPWGVVLVITVHAAPLAYAVIAAGLATRADPDLERAARMAGAGPWRAWSTITLPLLNPAMIAGGALVFVAAINSFGIPAVLGLPSGFSTATTRIYQDFHLSARPEAFFSAVVMAAGLVLVALAVVGTADAAGAASAVTPTAVGAGPAERRGRARWAASGLWLYLMLTTGVPLVALVLSAVSRAVGLSPGPANWTLDNFAEAVSGRFLEALGRSSLLAIVSATAVVILGGLLISLRRRGAGLGTVALLAFSVPGSALAVAVLLAYGRQLRDTLAIIFIAYLAKFWAIGHRTLAGSADAVAQDVLHAARVSGATPFLTLRQVILPLLRPAIAAAWLLTFLFALHELTISSLLYGPGTETLAVVILNLQQVGDLTVTSSLAVLLTLPVLGSALVLFTRKRPAWRLMGIE